MDREKVMQEIAAAVSVLEKCSAEEIEKVKRFLRWMPDDALMDVREKHRKALEKVAPAPVRK